MSQNSNYIKYTKSNKYNNIMYYCVLQGYSHGYQPDKKEDATPMVAFICGKPAMHFTPQGWVKDDKTDCLKDPNDVLSYCKSVSLKI